MMCTQRSKFVNPLKQVFSTLPMVQVLYKVSTNTADSLPKIISNYRPLTHNSHFLILNINQLDALNFIISLFQASTCSKHMCSSSGGQNCTIQPLVLSHLYVAVLCTGWERIQSSLSLCTGWPPTGVMIPETVIHNFALLTMSTGWSTSASTCKTNTTKYQPQQKLQHTTNWEQDDRCGN